MAARIAESARGVLVQSDETRTALAATKGQLWARLGELAAVVEDGAMTGEGPVLRNHYRGLSIAFRRTLIAAEARDANGPLAVDQQWLARRAYDALPTAGRIVAGERVK